MCGPRLSGFHKVAKPKLWPSVGLKFMSAFVNEDLNMAAMKFCPLQRLKWLKIKFKLHIRHLPEVEFGRFDVVTSFSNADKHFF